MLKLRLYLTLFILFTFFAVLAQDGWKLEKKKNGISVYTKPNPHSNLKDSRAVALVNADTKEVLNLLTDVENHWKWMDRIKISRLVNKVSDSEFYVYYEAVAPWPVSNRDIIARYKITMAGDGRIILESVGDPTYLPKKEGLVRIPKAMGRWEIIPKTGNTVEVVVTNHSDPGGGVPDWLANMTATDNPFNTLKNMKERLEQ